MGESKKRKTSKNSYEFSHKIVQIHEYELCYPGQFGEQSKDWLCAALPSDNDYKIASKALGAPVLKFSTTWDGEPIDVYIVENFENIPVHQRAVNADATIAHQGYLLSKGFSIAQVHCSPPIVGANVVRFTDDWIKIRLRHLHATAIVDGWHSDRHSREPLIKEISRNEYDVYVEDPDDADLIKAIIQKYERMKMAA